MTLLLNTVKAGANGATIAQADTTGGGAQLIPVGTSTLNITWDTTTGVDTNGSAKIPAVGNSQSRALYLPTSESPTLVTGAAFIRLSKLPTGAAMDIAHLSTASSAALRCAVDATGSVLFKLGNGSMVGAASTTKITPGVWYRVELAHKQGAAGSSLAAGQISEAHSATPLHSVSATTADTSTKVVNGFQIGVPLASATGSIGEMWVDQVRLETGTTTFPGAFVPPPAATTVDEAIRAVVASTRSALAKVELSLSGAELTLTKPNGTTKTVTLPASSPSGGAIGYANHIGDSLTYRAGAENIKTWYKNAGFAGAQVYGVDGKKIDVADSTGKTTVQNVIDMRAAGVEPAVWVIALGQNLSDESAMRAGIDAVCAEIDKGGAKKIAWVGTAASGDINTYKKTGDSYFYWINQMIKEKMTARGSNGLFVDIWNWTIANRPDELDNGAWFVDGIHMTPAGYLARYGYITGQVAQWLRGSTSGGATSGGGVLVDSTTGRPYIEV